MQKYCFLYNKQSIFAENIIIFNLRNEGAFSLLFLWRKEKKQKKTFPLAKPSPEGWLNRYALLWYRSQACALRVSDKSLYKFKGGDLNRGVEIAKNFLQHNAIKIAVVVAKGGADALQGELHGTV